MQQEARAMARALEADIARIERQIAEQNQAFCDALTEHCDPELAPRWRTIARPTVGTTPMSLRHSAQIRG